MKKVGFIGLGDMGMGMARNVLGGGFEVTGFDLREMRLRELERLGGHRAPDPRAIGEAAEAVFVMVLNGEQVKSVVLGRGGLVESMKPGSCVIVSATIEPSEVRELESPLAERSIDLIDTPVSGGKRGAEAGTLTLMSAAKSEVLERHREVLEAVAGKIFHVGETIGLGQTVKAALQAVIGTTFAGIFESLTLGAKAGVEGKVLYEVFSASAVGSPLLENCARLIMDRQFKGTGSQIGTMYKDLGITMGLARRSGVPMFTTSAAQELFQAGISSFPDEDNWSIVKLLEQIAGTEVRW